MKSFVKFLFMAASAMTVMLFPSCDKDDDGGSAGGSMSMFRLSGKALLRSAWIWV